jgi:hypothetical protein
LSCSHNFKNETFYLKEIKFIHDSLILILFHLQNVGIVVQHRKYNLWVYVLLQKDFKGALMLYFDFKVFKDVNKMTNFKVLFLSIFLSDVLEPLPRGTTYWSFLLYQLLLERWNRILRSLCHFSTHYCICHRQVSWLPSIISVQFNSSLNSLSIIWIYTYFTDLFVWSQSNFLMDSGSNLTLRERQTDNIVWMITISKSLNYIK